MQYFICVAFVLVVSTACYITTDVIGYRVIALILLMTVSFLAMLFEILPVLIAAILSAVIWNFFFIPPLYTFHINNVEDVLMFLLYFIIALLNAVLTSQIRKAEMKARDREEKENTIKLYNTLLNSLSHELRTPVSTILGAVDALKENRDRLTMDKNNELLSEIDKASLRLDRQVENLLNMSRLESGMLKPRMDWCDITELINSAINKNLPSDRHKIIFYQDENLPLFRLDAGLIEQAIHNLIHNAIQHTPENTIVEIRVSYLESTCIISVSDNGKGFPEDEIPYVFEKFYRSPNTKRGGIGLGLSVVKGFVEAHNGNVKLENNKNGGAKFTIEIPAETSFLNNLKDEQS